MKKRDRKNEEEDIQQNLFSNKHTNLAREEFFSCHCKIVSNHFFMVFYGAFQDQSTLYNNATHRY